MDLLIHHDSAACQFWAEPLPGQRCELDYLLRPGQVVFHHTGVPRALEGRGLAAQLVTHGLAWARAQGLKVVPSCSYVNAFMRRHPEWQDLRA